MDTIETTVLGEAHRRLAGDLAGLLRCVNEAPPGNLATVRGRLRQTREHLADHFRLEERGGYFASLRQREPRLERVIRELADEHQQLARDEEALIEAANTGATLNNDFRDQVRRWVRAVRHHEARENELVQDASNIDLGAED